MENEYYLLNLTLSIELLEKIQKVVDSNYNIASRKSFLIDAFDNVIDNNINTPLPLLKTKREEILNIKVPIIFKNKIEKFLNDKKILFRSKKQFYATAIKLWLEKNK